MKPDVLLWGESCPVVLTAKMGAGETFHRKINQVRVKAADWLVGGIEKCPGLAG